MDNDIFEGILEGLNEAVRHANGEKVPGLRIYTPEELDVKAIREETGLSQERFADQFGFTIAQVRNFEQHRSRPIGGERAYLELIRKEPGVMRALVSKHMGERKADNKRSTAKARTLNVTVKKARS